MVELVKYCSSRNIVIAVRSGGHGYTSQSLDHHGFSENFVVLVDMRSMNKLLSIFVNDVNTMKSYVTMEAGALWKDILPQLDKLGMVTVHGQCTSVGIAGFILHGNISCPLLDHNYTLLHPYGCIALKIVRILEFNLVYSILFDKIIGFLSKFYELQIKRNVHSYVDSNYFSRRY